jgi:hypothetical protein
MTQTVAEPRRGWRPARMPPTWTIVWALFAVLALELFAFFGARYLDQTQREVRLLPWLRYDQRVDFNYFYSGAKLTYHGQARDLYPLPGEWTYYPGDPVFDQPQDELTLARLLARGNYYNPPALALLQAPLVALGFKYAFFTFVALASLALAATLFLAWRAGRGIAEMPFLILGIISFSAIHEAVIMGHMTLFFILVLAAGFLLLRAERSLLAGLTFSMLALKPQWAILPALFLLVRGQWRGFFAMGLSAAAIFFLPFIYTGFDSFRNYFEFLRWSATVDLRDAPHMFSWNGFLSKMDDSEVQNGVLVLFADAPPKALIYGLMAITVLPLLVVWRSGDYLLGVAATLVAMLLVSTHSVWYDWAILAVAALFLVLRTRQAGRGYRVEMWVVLLALYVSVGQSIDTVLAPDRHLPDWHRAGFFSATLVAFASLVWMASVALRDRGIGLLLPPAHFWGSAS